MALWRPFRGNRTSLDAVEKHDGYVYFCVDDATLFFDYTDADGNLQRKQINSKDAETLVGKTLEELKAEFSSQSDWNQNDENALDHVKNRTHWVEDDGETYHPLDEKFIPDTIARTADVQPKNLIVKYQEGSLTTVTHNSIQIADAADAGVEVKFFDGLEYLSLLEYSREQYFAVFYADYYDSSNILNIKYVLIDNTNNVMMADTSRHNVAFKTDLEKKQDKINGSSGQYAQFNSSGKLVGAALDLTEAKEYTDTKIADLVNSARLITLEEIDEICGGSIQYAEDVMF